MLALLKLIKWFCRCIVHKNPILAVTKVPNVKLKSRYSALLVCLSRRVWLFNTIRSCAAAAPSGNIAVSIAGQAKAGNFSQALVLGYGLHKDHGAFGDAAVVVDANTSLSWDQSTKSLDIGWVAGYRLNDDWLLYGGPFVVKHDIDMSSRFRQPGDDYDTINPKRNFNGKQLGANIAAQYEFFHHMSLNLELISAKYRMDGVTQSDTQLNLMLGVRFKTVANGIDSYCGA